MAESIQTTESGPARNRPDRRQRPTPIFSRYTLFGRRKGNRRTADPRANYFVDTVRGIYLQALILVVLMILTDVVSTLHILRMGGGEANPLMRWLLELGTFWFIFVKVTMALGAAVLLVVHRRFRVATILTPVLLTVYVALACYHGVLLFRIHG